MIETSSAQHPEGLITVLRATAFMILLGHSRVQCGLYTTSVSNTCGANGMMNPNSTCSCFSGDPD